MKKAEFKRLKTSSCSPALLLQPDDHDHASAADLISLNDDLLIEILVRFSARSIFHFRSVSKQWLSFLTHPRFTLWFDKLLKSPGFYYHKFYVSFDVGNPTTPLFPSLASFLERTVQSCNGLLLCYYEQWRRYYVCNPTTKKVVDIPTVIGDQSCSIHSMGLAYHPTECARYKLVCILRAGYTRSDGGFSKDRHRMYNIQIYSSQTGEWKKLNQTFAPDYDTEFRYGVYWNAAFHWAPSCRNPMYLRLDTEQIHELPLPVRFSSSWKGDYMPIYFGESRGHLHWVDTAKNNNLLNMNVYEMLRDHSGWFIKYLLDLHQLSAAYPYMTHKYQSPLDKYKFRVLDVVRVGGEGEEENTFLVVKAVDDIKRYNIPDQSFKQLFSIPNNIKEGFKYHRYIEKLGSF